MREIIPKEHNPALRKTAQPLSPEAIVSDEIRDLIAQMQALLAKEKYGVALAAPQVGEAIRLFIVSGKAIARDSRNAPDEPESENEVDESDDESSIPDQVYINPELIKLSRKRVGKHEGCLSIRGKWGIVPRAEKATIRAYDEEGRRFTRGASGFLAHVFQHEMDHLDGVLYIDKATELYDDEPDDEN
ncbi:MAG: peptide deformylase [Candidatus Pacebacteria bacterium]|nr:peptide deformylase [Candidatus Paceibacterota bacterium]